jgi:hypothetical protein
MPYGASTAVHCDGLWTSALANMPVTWAGTVVFEPTNSRHAGYIGGESTATSGAAASGVTVCASPQAARARTTTSRRTGTPHKSPGIGVELWDHST